MIHIRIFLILLSSQILLCGDSVKGAESPRRVLWDLLQAPENPDNIAEFTLDAVSMSITSADIAMMVMRRTRLLGATTCKVNGVAFYFPVVESDEYLSKLRASVMFELKSPDDILTLINDHKNEVCLIHAGTYADFSEVWKVAKLLNANKVPFHFQIMDELVHKVKVGFLK